MDVSPGAVVTGWWTGVANSHTAWAYSVRPDLWGPGWAVELRSRSGTLTEWSHYRDHLHGWAAKAEVQGLGDPGAAEALVLAGQVLEYWQPPVGGGTVDWRLL